MFDNSSILNVLTQGLLSPGLPPASVLTQGFPQEIKPQSVGSTGSIPLVDASLPIPPFRGNASGRVAPVTNTPIILDTSGNPIYTRSLSLACNNKPAPGRKVPPVSALPHPPGLPRG